MPVWDPKQYLAFADERGRPFVDLVGRIPGEAESVVDLGCGPGQLTHILRQRWPSAVITGVDSSPEMIDKATSDNADPQASYVLADVTDWSGDADVIVSNAMFQWVPDALDVVSRLTEHTKTIAIQVPDNFAAPSHALMHELARTSPYAEHLQDFEFRIGLDVDAYLDFFAGIGWAVDAWDTTYRHVLQGDDPVFEWISGTGARPVLQALPDGVREHFVTDYKAALRDAYPSHSWGTVLPFKRAFVVARKP